MTPKEVQAVLGGTMVADTYPLVANDGKLWLKFLSRAVKADGRLYSMLVWMRSIGIRLERSDKFGYRIVPIFKGNTSKFGWNDMKEWNNVKQKLMPYLKTIKVLLRDLDK